MTWAVAPWKRSDGADRMRNHLFAEAILEREVSPGFVQIIERVKVEATNAYERPSYRLLHVLDGHARIANLHDTLKETKAGADRFVEVASRPKATS